MHTSRRVLLLLIPLITLGAPSIALAFPDNVAPSPYPFVMFNEVGNGSAALVSDVTDGYSTASAVWQDFKNGGSSTYGSVTSAQIEAAKSGIEHSSPPSDNRICKDIDTEWGPNPNGSLYNNYPVQGSSMDESNGHNNFVWCTSNSGNDCKNALSYPSWVFEHGDSADSKPSGIANYDTAFECATGAKPQNTLSANTTNVNSGDPVKLTWDDNVPRDKVLIRSGDPQCQSDSAPASTCTASQSNSQTDFQLTGTTVNNWQPGSFWTDTGNAAVILAAAGGHCGINGPPATRSYFKDDKTGSVTVHPVNTTGSPITVTYTYSCSNPNGTTNAKVNVTVQPSAATAEPDLKAGDPSPSSATVGTGVNLKSTISNVGDAATGGTFNVLFEIDNDATHNNLNQVDDLEVVSGNSALTKQGGSNDSEVSTLSNYKFAHAGTWYVQVCADENKSGNGVIDESNENNNCSGWSTVDVSPGAELSLTTPINLGEATTLTYECDEGDHGGSAGGTGVITSNNNAGTCNGVVLGSDGKSLASGNIDGNAHNIDCIPNPQAFDNPPKTNLNYTLTCTDSKGNSASATANNLVINAPELYVSDESGPSSLAQNTATTLSGTVTNEGSINTNQDPSSSPFPNLLDIQEKVSGTWTDVASLWKSNTMSTLTAATGATPSRTATFANVSFPDAASYRWRICADNNTSWNGTVTESDETNNCGVAGAWTTITVGAASLPDLTAGDVSTSPASPTTQSATTLSAVITNGGTAATGAGFKDLFEIDNDTNHATLNDVYALRTYSSAALSANGGNNTASVSYTFPTAGTWYLRACADEDTTGAGTIDESNENNNCGNGGAWVPITVGGGTGASCTGVNTSGDQVTWTASSGYSSYSWNANATGATPSTQSGSSRTFTTTYPGTGSYAATVDTGSGPQSCTPVDIGASCGAPATTFTADPTRVKQGDTSTLTWSSISGVDSSTDCSITSDVSGGGSHDIGSGDDDSCSINGGSWQTPGINTETKYCMICGGTQVSCATVDVIPNIQEF